MDQARSLIELAFQAFYLLRSTDPNQAALDAFNLSAIRWAGDRQRLLEAGLLPADTLDLKGDHKRAQVEENVFSKYAGRRPRFYADKTAQQTAKAAGLEKAYELTYGALSGFLHGSPMAERNLTLPKPGANIELAAVPSRGLLDMMWTAFAVGSQAAVIATIGGLATFVEVDPKFAIALIEQFHAAYPNDWEPELHTLAVAWGLKWRSDSVSG
jgi:hypothetical protein